MITDDDIQLYLETLAEKQPQAVIRELEQGSIVYKSLGLCYEIDDPDIDRQLGDFPDDTIPYSTIP